MPICASCDHDNPDDARFCMSCGAGLAAPAERRDERKVVSILFADLVGFTSRAEQLDVEEVRGTLEAYHATVRALIESFGGTVEKFAGDAVMAVFGAPTAREDDAERAVRAGLATLDAVADLGHDLQVRVGICTGEALVALGTQAGRGEALVSGDVVNTAARLQTAAPVDAVLVGEATFRATERAIVYDAHAPVAAKGKAEPVAAWVAREPRSLVPGAVREVTPLVGRGRERRLLVDALERCRAERSVQLVTIVGVPGIGKTRLVQELRRHVEDEREITRWREGRSLAYGDGVGFWPLAEIVKQEAGILESDDAATAAGKLGDAIAALGLAGTDAVWVRRQLAPLAGVEAQGEAGGREEAFAGWRLFLEACAADRPTVLVVEDLHWADEALLDFLDELATRVGDVPLLVVCTARPELWERRPGWGGGKANALAISLQSLSGEETEELVRSLIDPTLLRAEAVGELLVRAEGNPLYAQEYVRVLVERGGGAAELPASVQGIIAARLDALTPEEKSLLQDAAVIGRTSWLGALCALGGRDRAEVDELVFGLERKQLLRRARRTSVAEEHEVSFAHALIEEVAYTQLTRAQRAARHELAAAWIQELAGDRDDRSELVAHHLATALALRTALGEDVAELRARTLAALLPAVRQADARHDHAATIALADQALALDPAPDPCAELLSRVALAQYFGGVATEEAFVAARDAAVAAGRIADAAANAYYLAEWAEGAGVDAVRLEALGQEAYEIAADAPPGPLTALPSYAKAYRFMIQARYAEGLAFSEREMARAQAAGDAQAVALVQMWRGSARMGLADVAGIEDLRASYLTLDRYAHPKAAAAAANLAELLIIVGYLDEAEEALENARAWAARTGQSRLDRVALAMLALVAYHRGDRDRVEELLEAAERVPVADSFSGTNILLCRARLELDTRPDAALERAREALRFADTSGNDEQRADAYAVIARAEAARGDARAAMAAADGFLEHWRTSGVQQVWSLPDIGVVLAAAGRHAELAEVAGRRFVANPWADAARALAAQDYDGAAAILEAVPSIPLRDAVRELAATTV